MGTAASGGNVLHQIQIQIIGNLSLLVSNLQQAQNQTQNTTQNMQTNFQKVTSSVAQLGDRLRIIPQFMSQILEAGAAVFSGIAIKNFIEDITRLAARVEVLEVVSKQVGKTAGYSASYIDNLVKSIEKMNITTQQANLSVALMIQANLDLSKATQLARVAQDAAVIANVSSQEALQGLIHGIVTLQPRILRTYNIIVNLQLAYRRYAAQVGTSFDELEMGTKQQIALNEVLRVGERIQGTYLAAMQKAGKQLLSLERLTEQFKLAMGREFQEGFSRLISTLYKFFEWAEQSKNLKAAFRSIANVLDNLAQKVLWFITFAAKHPDLLLSIFNVVIITGIARSIGALVGSVAQLIVVLGSAGLANKIGIIVGLASALGYALSKLPFYFSALVGIIPTVTIVIAAMQASAIAGASALVGLRLGLMALFTTIPGGVALIALISGAIGMIIPLFRGMGENANQASDDLKRMEQEVSNAANSARDLKIQALDLAKGFIALYESTEQSDTRTADLEETMKDLKGMLPSYLIGITDVTEAYNKMKGSMKDLVKETALYTEHALNLTALNLQGKLTPKLDEAKKKYVEFDKWVQTNLTQEITPEQAAFSEPAKAGALAFDFFVKKVSEVQDRIKAIQDIATTGRGASLLPDLTDLVREDWNVLQAYIVAWESAAKNARDLGLATFTVTDAVTKTTQTFGTQSVATENMILEYAGLTEGLVVSTEAYTGLQKELDATNKKIQETKDLQKTGVEPPPKKIITPMQSDDANKLEDELGRIIRMGNTYRTKALEPTLKSVAEEVNADIATALSELDTERRFIEDMMTKPAYIKVKNDMPEFQRALAIYQDTYNQIMLAKVRMGNKAASEFISTQYDSQEKVLKDQVKAGEKSENALRLFYAARIQDIQQLGSKASSKMLEQEASYKGALSDMDKKELDQRERFYRSMLKHDLSYYDRLIGVMNQKLPAIIAQYGAESEEAVDAKDAIIETQREQVLANVKKYKRLAENDAKYYPAYLAQLDAVMEDGHLIELLGLALYKEIQAERVDASDRATKATIEQWRKQHFVMALINDQMVKSFSSMIKSFTNLEMTGKKRREEIWQSFLDFFTNIISELIAKWVTFMILSSLFPGAYIGMSFGDFMKGKKGGGYTGDASENEVTGFHHGKEYVLNAEATKRWRPLLDMLNFGKTSGVGMMADSLMYGMRSGGIQQTGVMMSLMKSISKLSDHLLLPQAALAVDVQSTATVDARGLHIATVSGRKRTRMAGL